MDSQTPTTSVAQIAYDEDDTMLTDAIVLEERSRRQNRKYGAEEIIYRARIDLDRIPSHVQDMRLNSIVGLVRELFTQLIRRTTEGLAPTDLIRFFIQADGLDRPISTSLMQVQDLTVEKILAAVMKVLQSKTEIRLDNGFSVDVITIRRPVGAGKTHRKVINIAMDRLRMKSVFAVPSDEEGLCCAKAIVYALAHLRGDKTAIEAFRKPNRPALMNRAYDLHLAAQVPAGPCTFKEIAVFEAYLNVQIVVFSADTLNRVAYKGQNRPERINLWLHDNHYDVLKSLPAFFGSNHYCTTCEKPYQDATSHRCAEACFICLRTDCLPGDKVRCADCQRLCLSENCFAAHKAITGNEQFSICDRIYQCRECHKVIRRRNCVMEEHKCGTVKCPSCKKFVVLATHHCYLMNVSPKKPSLNLIFFDFETDQSSGEHIVNFAVAQYADGREAVFKGYGALDEFCAWLFTPAHKDFTAIAHNMKGFDGQFIMAWMLRQGTTPDVIPNGSMLMSIHHTTLSIRIIDSLNFFPMSLAKLPASFGLTELKKGYFPHLFNTRGNQTYVGALPDPKYYTPETMAPSAHRAFMEWHQQHAGDIFDFQEEMLTYCRSDVDILRRCCLDFRTQFLAVADVDPFRYVTIASACMAVYRHKHIQPDTIAMVPVRGYVNSTNYSVDAIRWLDFIASTEEVEILHALNNTGEQKLMGVSVDGYCPGKKTIYQYHGCFYHGCDKCFDGDAVHPLKGVPMGQLKQKTEETTQRLRGNGYTVIEMWEHDFVRQKKEDPCLKEFLQSHSLEDRLVPRDSFFGGRTNAVKLFHEGAVKYVDFTSLYPWVNKYCQYPVGHPEIVTDQFKDVDSYFGLIRCRVVPPKGLYLPVLPVRCQNKLMFPLCRICAETLQKSVCQHTPDERAIVGTWVTEEVKLAKKKGYLITHIYEVYHFAEKSDSLFRSYIDLFLKIKQESSGWPVECVDDDSKANYIKDYMEREGVALNTNDIAKNPGRRQVAKLALNSFWGRWGMNTNKGQLTYVDNLADFNKHLCDSTKNVKEIYLPTPEVAAIQWEAAREFVQQDASTNIFIAAFTTAWARLKLYGEMDKLGRDVLYHDTDSIIYISRGYNDPKLGNFLGEFSDELDGDVISTFVSGGPKNYAYQTAKGVTCCKVRGFTLNFRNSQKLNFDSIKSLVCSMDTTPIPLYNPAKICREAKRRRVLNKEETKLYKIVYNKRVLQEDFSTLPYGY